MTFQEYFNSGVKKSESGDFQGALVDFNQAIRLDTNHAGVWNHRGCAKENLKDYRGAIQDFDRCLQVEAGSYGTFYYTALQNRAYIKCINLGESQSAIDDANEILRTAPRYPSAYKIRGIARAHLGAYQEAIRDFDRWMELPHHGNDASSGTQALVLRTRGNAKDQLEDYLGALKDYEASLRYQRHGFVHIAIAEIKIKLNQYQAAIEECDKALSGEYRHHDQRALEVKKQAESLLKENDAIKEKCEFLCAIQSLLGRGCCNPNDLSDVELQLLNKDFQALEPRAIVLKQDRFFIIRAQFFEKTAAKVSYEPQKQVLYRNALQDYQKALTLNPFSSEAGEKLAALQQLMQRPSPAAAGMFAPAGGGAAVSAQERAEIEKLKEQMRRQGI